MRLVLSKPHQRYLNDSQLLAAAFAMSLFSHLLLVHALPGINDKSALPLVIEANLVQLLPPPKPEPPPEVVPQTPPQPSKPLPNPKPVKPLPVLEKAPGKEKADQNIRQGFALPVLAAEGKGEADSNEYTVPEMPPENIGLASQAFGTVPAPNTGSMYGSPTDTEIATIPEPPSDFIWNTYGRDIQQQAKKYAVYPSIARQRGQQGTVEVIFRIGADSQLKSLSIHRSSGYKLLDEEAQEMVRKSLNDIPVPMTLSGRTFQVVIPVEFKLM